MIIDGVVETQKDHICNDTTSVDDMLAFIFADEENGWMLGVKDTKEGTSIPITYCPFCGEKLYYPF